MFGSKPTVPTITVDLVKSALDRKEDVTILDVRTSEEVAKARIAGSINIPVDTVASMIVDVLPDKNKTIYVYCLSGSRSVVAVRMMMNMGYKHVFDMKNGLLAWRAMKYPVEN